MTPREILLAAADLIEQPGKWTQGASERDEFGNDLENDKRADGHDIEDDDDVGPPVCWCAMGALFHVAGDPHFGAPAIEQCVDAVVSVLNIEPLEAHVLAVTKVSEFNDAAGRTAKEVADKMREAAATLKE